MTVLSCVYNEIQYLYRRFNTTIKSSTEVNYFDPGLTSLWPAICTLIKKVSEGACQWNGHDVVISIHGIFFYTTFVCYMTHKEKLSIQWPCSSNFRCFARDFRVFFKVWSSRNFLKSRRLWVWRTHTMGWSPLFLGGPGGMLPWKIFENRTLENEFPSILGLET